MASPGLQEVTQVDFSAGMVRSVAPHLIPDNGFYDAINLLLNSDGSPYKRGGTSYKSNTAFGTSLRFLWDGYLAGGQRTVFATPAKLGTLGADDATPVDVGFGGLVNPVRPAVLLGVMYFPGGLAYGGSRKSAEYSTGAVAVTNGSKTVTGTGTTWGTNVDAGMLLRVNSTGSLYAVASVDSDTQVTLAVEYNGTTATNQPYTVSTAVRLDSPYRLANVYAAAANRLVTGEGSRVYFSAIRNPASFTDTDYHELPGGVQVIGMEYLQGHLLIFTTGGVWTLNNLAYDLEDAAGNVQQSLQKLDGDMVCWGNEGIASYRGALIVPAADGVWLMDTISTPQPIGSTIAPLLASYVKSGYKPGLAAVHNHHYFLPVLDPANVLVDMLVCRLDRPVRTRLGTVFPWTRLAGSGVSVCALANRVTSSRQSVLLGALPSSVAKVVQFPPLAPDVANTTDPDGTVPSWRLTTRDLPTNGVQTWLTKKARVRYELVTSSSATMQLAYGTDSRSFGSVWGTATWGTGTWTDPDDTGFTSATGDAAADDGSHPNPWLLNRRARWLRLRLSSTGATARMIVRSIELFVRAAGRQ